MAVRLACLKAFRKSSLFAFGAESGRDRGRGRGRRQSSSCLEGFKLAPRLTGIAQSREAFRKIWLSSWADTLSIFALRILDSRRTLCLCRRRDGRPRQNNLGGGRAPVELKAVPHSWVCLKSSAGHGTRITLRSPSPGTATLKPRTGVASPPPSFLLSSLPPSWPRGLSCRCQRPRWFGSRLQPSREFINVLIHLQFFQDFSKMANFGELSAPRASWIGASSRRGAFTGSRRPQSPPCAAIFCLCPSALLGSPPPPSSIVGHGSLLVKATLVLL